MTHLNLNTGGSQTGSGSLAARDSGATHAPTGLDALLREPSFTFSGANQRGLANGPGLEDDWPPIDVVGKLEEFDLFGYVDSTGKFPGEIISPDILNSVGGTGSGTITTEVSSEANRAEVEAAQKKLDAEIKTLQEKLKNYPDSTKITKKDKNGKTVVLGTVGELKKILSEIKFTVTDKSLGKAANGVEKMATADPSAKTVIFNAKAINSSDTKYLLFVLTHEVAHFTKYILNFDQKMIYQFVKGVLGREPKNLEEVISTIDKYNFKASQEYMRLEQEKDIVASEIFSLIDESVPYPLPYSQ